MSAIFDIGIYRIVYDVLGADGLGLRTSESEAHIRATLDARLAVAGYDDRERIVDAVVGDWRRRTPAWEPNCAADLQEAFGVRPGEPCPDCGKPCAIDMRWSMDALMVTLECDEHGGYPVIEDIAPCPTCGEGLSCGCTSAPVTV